MWHLLICILLRNNSLKITKIIIKIQFSIIRDPLWVGGVSKVKIFKVEEAKSPSGNSRLNWKVGSLHLSMDELIQNWHDFELVSCILSSKSTPILNSWLQMVITSLFQLWFVYYLNYWTPNFPKFKLISSLAKNDL